MGRTVIATEQPGELAAPRSSKEARWAAVEKQAAEAREAAARQQAGRKGKGKRRPKQKANIMKGAAPGQAGGTRQSKPGAGCRCVIM
ncbi:hypothetical protein PsYK624_063210 [Phanerochaete sordida]|uniref:Uncharacterized protein n=1 Tax=Phanerochaete sordida TaxID=48140 RepID=A0A9P3GA42_9APHY|nr:hypothetical protein PsYK624_063210 [Phanerochaete sordida]